MAGRWFGSAFLKRQHTFNNNIYFFEQVFSFAGFNHRSIDGFNPNHGGEWGGHFFLEITSGSTKKVDIATSKTHFLSKANMLKQISHNHRVALYIS